MKASCYAEKYHASSVTECIGVRSLGGGHPHIGAVYSRTGESELVPALPPQWSAIHQNFDQPSFSEQKCVQA